MRMLNFPSAYQPGETPYQIFKDRMNAINSIVGGIKDIVANKFINKQNAMIAENIQNEIDKQKAIDLSNLILGPPPNEIYPDNLEDTVGQFYDKFAMGPMMQKEIMMGNLPAPEPEMGPMMQKEMMTGGLPAVGGVTPTPTPAPTTEAMIPKTDLYQLYNVIKDLPTGQITWDNIYKKMTEKKPWFMGATGPEEFVLNQMMGQVGDPRSKLASDINLTKLMQEAFYPEVEEEKITSEIDFFRKDPAGYAEMLKLKQDIIGEKKTAWETEAETLFKWYEGDIINLDEFKKGMGIYIAPEKMSDFDKKFALASQMNLTSNEWKKFFSVYIPEEGEATKVKYYETSAEVVANEPKIEGFMIDPTLDRTKGWYANYVKETKEDPNNYLFGKKDVYGNISRMGIIPYDAQMQISYGQPLTDIQKTQIRNNHNLQKSLLDEEMLPKVEAILRQIGVPLTEPIPEVTPEVTSEVTPKPKVEMPKMQPIWGLDEALKEAPPMEVPTEKKLALIPTMTNDELYNALRNLYDPSDPIYKALYDEAVKRGLITK